MKNEEILIAGYGGQGVLSMGKILAYAGLMQGKEVCWMPSYGPEMRGGTANVTVIVGDEQVNSPIITEYDTVVILNKPSLDKFEKTVKPGGKLFYDSNGLPYPPSRKDINIYHIPAAQETVKIGNPKIFNMVVLGGLFKKLSAVDANYVEAALKKSLPERAHKLIPLNLEAFYKGADILEVIYEL
ncbi:MAG: 2-oxoacid:acceptor oxidoreductase family protein [Bacteroidales bacterium]|nr:2-oxoacid:acceptor oxidoreductase family protein [Bacteroidales bacterium]